MPRSRSIGGLPIISLALIIGICLALLAVSWAQSSMTTRDWQALAILAVLAFAAELLPVPLSTNGLNVTVSMPIICAVLVVYGPFSGAIVDGIASCLAGYIGLRNRTDLIKWPWITFNTAQSMISAAGAGLVVSLVSYNRTGHFTPSMLLASVICVVSYMLINSFTVAWMVYQTEGRPIRACLISQWRMVGPQYLVHGLMALLIIAPYNVTGGWSLAAIFVPILAARKYFFLRARQMNTYRETIRALGLMIQTAHPYTGGHLDRVAVWGSKTAQLLHLNEKDVELVYDAALLHDIGKIAVSEEILNKPAKLDEEEWKMVRKHPEIGAQIIGEIKLLEPLVSWVGLHHERPDGRGYPFGLKDAEIPIQSKIIAVVDAFDAMAGGSTPADKRPYREPLTIEDALIELRRNAGTQFDPRVVEAFTHVVKGSRE